ncbi:hypothetical protein GCM10009839_02800 [Catenulispora yoronensis]|uniref:Uncharacterized protein n=1 Tax=Catenulispora yoronensis TaxID=450799 RepID=A0ABP5F3L4_9ACTN
MLMTRPSSTSSSAPASTRESRLNPLTLIGCELAYRGPHPLPPRSYTQLVALDRTGRVLDSFDVVSEVEEIRPSVLGAALVDITLPHFLFAPPTAARPIWEIFSAGLPAEPNQWAGLPTGVHSGLARLRHSARGARECARGAGRAGELFRRGRQGAAPQEHRAVAVTSR